MIFIEHRKNSITELKEVNQQHGVEIDLRSIVDQPGKMHLSHDPWKLGDEFEEWLKEYIRLGLSNIIILNTKEDGLEEAIIELLNNYGIKNYLFLDSTIPTLIKWSEKGYGEHFFFRLSKYESVESLLNFKDHVKWVWVDCFKLEPLTQELITQLKDNFHLCMVSPELHGGTEQDFPKFLPLASLMHAICTKKPEQWKNLISGSNNQ